MEIRLKLGEFKPYFENSKIILKGQNVDRHAFNKSLSFIEELMLSF
jgi:hypothetical protein